VTPELEESIHRDERGLPGYAAMIGRQNESEPYRRKLSFIWWRLGNDGYASADELGEDLAVIRRSLEAHRGGRIAAGRLAARSRRVELFGFHVAKLDIRLHAREVREPTKVTRSFLDAAAEARRAHGPGALDTLIVSGCSTAADALGVLELTGEPISIVPLFETIADLHAAPRIVRDLLADPRYGGRVAERGG